MNKIIKLLLLFSVSINFNNYATGPNAGINLNIHKSNNWNWLYDYASNVTQNSLNFISTTGQNSLGFLSKTSNNLIENAPTIFNYAKDGVKSGSSYVYNKLQNATGSTPGLIPTAEKYENNLKNKIDKIEFLQHAIKHDSNDTELLSNKYYSNVVLKNHKNINECLDDYKKNIKSSLNKIQGPTKHRHNCISKNGAESFDDLEYAKVLTKSEINDINKFYNCLENNNADLFAFERAETCEENPYTKKALEDNYNKLMYTEPMKIGFKHQLNAIGTFAENNPKTTTGLAAIPTILLIYCLSKLTYKAVTFSAKQIKNLVTFCLKKSVPMSNKHVETKVKSTKKKKLLIKKDD